MKNEGDVSTNNLYEQLTEEERAILFSEEDVTSEVEEKRKSGKFGKENIEADKKEKELVDKEKDDERDMPENKDSNLKNGRKSGRFLRKTEKKKEKTKKNREKGKKRKLKKKWMIVGGVVAVFVILTIGKSVATSLTAESIEVSTAKIGEIKKSLDTSGTFKSMKKRVYFSPVSATVSKCYVEVGDIVKEGEKLVDFDLSELQTKQTEQNLQKDSNYYSYADSLEKSKKAEQDLSNAESEITRLKNQISIQKNNISNIQNYISELNRNQGLDSTKDSDTSSTTSTSRISSNVESMLASAQRDLEKAQSDLSDLQSDLSKSESEKEQAKSSILTDDEKKKLEVEKYSAELSAEVAGQTVTKGSTGIKSEFDGIVTDIKTPTGSMATEGGELLTIESNQEIVLEVSLSKYDLEVVEEGENAKITLGDYTYDGIVSKISRSAIQNTQGKSSIMAEITVLKPDDNIYLGIEGKVTIEGKTYSNILVIPTECINASKKNSYCYVVKDSKVEKRDIKTGATDGEKTQVIDGLKQGEQVVLNSENITEDGKEVIAMEENTMENNAEEE